MRRFCLGHGIHRVCARNVTRGGQVLDGLEHGQADGRLIHGGEPGDKRRARGVIAVDGGHSRQQGFEQLARGGEFVVAHLVLRPPPLP